MATSAFFEFGIGVNGLLASQKSLTVTGNNITNANTKGYSRQAVVQKATRALPASGAGMIGTGSEVTSISRVRDTYIDTKYRLQNNKYSEYDIKSEKMKELSMRFNEPSDTGINTVISDLFGALQDLTTNASDSSYFENVVGSTETLLETVNTIGEALATEQALVNDEIKYAVDDINSIARQIQSLNLQIEKFEIHGNEASSLRDERDVLLDELSKYANVTTSEDLIAGTENSYRFTVKINGQELVCQDRINTLMVEKKVGFLNPEDREVVYDIVWDNGFDFNEYSSTLTGKLRGLIDIRDGNGGKQFSGSIKDVNVDFNGIVTLTLSDATRGDIGDSGMINIYGVDLTYGHSEYDASTNEIKITLSENVTAELNADGIYEAYMLGEKGRVPLKMDAVATIGSENSYRGIPYYTRKLNEFVRTLAGAMNEGIYRDGTQMDGFVGSVNGYTQDGDTGMYMITYLKDDGVALGKGDFVDYEKMTVYNISVSKELMESSKNIPISAVNNPGESQLDLVQNLAKIAHASLFKEGEVADYMTSIISEVAMDVNQADKYKNVEENLLLYNENKRSEVSGVVNNEEMTNLVKFQSAYKASARIINVMNEVYDVLVNGIFS